MPIGELEVVFRASLEPMVAAFRQLAEAFRAMDPGTFEEPPRQPRRATRGIDSRMMSARYGQQMVARHQRRHRG
jgi:hypothetical protein